MEIWEDQDLPQFYNMIDMSNQSFVIPKIPFYHSFPDLAQHPSRLFTFLFFNILDNRNYKIPNHPPDQLKRIVGPNSLMGPSMFNNL